MRKKPNHKIIPAFELGFASFMIFAGTVLPILFMEQTAIKNQSALYGLELVAAAGLSLQFMIYLTKSSRRILRTYLLAAVLITPFLILAAF